MFAFTFPPTFSFAVVAVFLSTLYQTVEQEPRESEVVPVPPGLVFTSRLKTEANSPD